MCRNAQFFEMYLTSLPDHAQPGFDEKRHFSRFKQHNMVFNAFSRQSNCDRHVGCLSLKSVLSGEEWYGIGSHRLAVRPGKFLILNDDQEYSSRIDGGDGAHVLSVFFKREFAAEVFSDILCGDEAKTADPSVACGSVPEFFQTLNELEPGLERQLTSLVAKLDLYGYDVNMMDEHLVFLLRWLVGTFKAETRRLMRVDAVKAATKKELYRRLCIAKDLLHSCYQQKLELAVVSATACMSLAQLIRQFRVVFGLTPYQYLIRVRLEHAARMLKGSSAPVGDIGWQCGFENTSAFCRAFRTAYDVPPERFRRGG
jgi:AraC family transcriptional regulator